MKTIGITGGTGGGKTTVLRELEARGAFTIDCDALYHEMLQSDERLLGALRGRFPAAFPGGVFDRKALGRIVFADEAALQALNGITHACVTGEVSRRLRAAQTRGFALAGVDAIGLFESGLDSLCSDTIGVLAPRGLRARRIMLREGIAEEYALLRIDAQKGDEYYVNHCGHILVNDCDDMEGFRKKCAELINKITEVTPMNIYDELESGVRSYCRSFPVSFDRAKMSRMYGSDGKAYLDFFNGAGALSYGHNNDYIKVKLLAYVESDGISHALDLHTAAKEAFLTTFRDRVLAPRGMDYKVMFCGPTGTNAVEASLKLARKATGRQGIFAFTGSFHGMTMGSLAVTSGKSHRAGAGMALHDTTFVPHPYYHRELDILKYIEELVCDEYSGVEKPAAFIIETMQAEGGVVPLESGFISGLSELCARLGILLIVDDIQVGCGRCGTFFSFERAGIQPDLVVLSKSISGYGLPMSLLLIKPQHDIWKPAEHNGTFRGNQLAFVGATAALEYRDEHRLGEKVAEDERFIADFVRTRLLPLSDKLEYRGIGMIHGVDFGAVPIADAAGEVARECFRNGLVIERAGRDDCVLKIMPALTIERTELTEGLEIIEKAAKKVLGGR